MAPRQRYTYQGESLTLTALARKYGLGQKTLYYRVVTLGWDMTKALETPVHDPRLRHAASAMRWCAKHERAWHPAPLNDPPGWAPMPRGTVALALAYAKAFGCVGQITIAESPCDYCETA